MVNRFFIIANRFRRRKRLRLLSHQKTFHSRELFIIVLSAIAVLLSAAKDKARMKREKKNTRNSERPLGSQKRIEEEKTLPGDEAKGPNQSETSNPN
jgi:hypothetical protein